MMRQIKFRGKCLQDCYNYKKGDWVYGGIGKSSIADIWYIFQIEPEMFVSKDLIMHFKAIKVDTKTVSQFTGFKDKNDKEIYEGDILKVGRVGKVYYSDCLGCYYVDLVMTEADKKCGVTNPDLFYWVSMDCEVIGNIHKNPELLK